MAIGFLLQEWF